MTSSKMDDQKCPRCQVNPAYPRGADPGAVSVVTREGMGGVVTICPDCGVREAHRQAEGWKPIGSAEWPLSIDELLREDRLRYEFARNLEILNFRLEDAGDDHERED
jgi:hypothetical protein